MKNWHKKLNAQVQKKDERYLTDKINSLPSSYGRKFAVGVKRTTYRQ